MRSRRPRDRINEAATGLPYRKTRRLLICSRLQEKCPAVSGVDSTVIGDSAGTTVRRHELHFRFDAGRCRERAAELAIRLEDDPDDRGNDPHVYTFAPGLHRNSGERANEDTGWSGGDSSIGEICTDQNGNLHHLPGTESLRAGASDPHSRPL